MNIFGDIGSMEHHTKMQVKGPIFERTYQVIKSKYAYEKIFEQEFDRAHYSVFTLNYKDVFNEAHDEALDSIWDSTYQIAKDSVFES